MNSTSTSISSSTPSLLPRDARLIALLLAANGAEDCEEGVVRMLVEFAHRYTSDILTDSLLYAEHARSTSSSSNQGLTPSIDDIRLAIQQRTESASVPKEFLLQLATQVNSVPLPPVPEVYGIRLPPTSQRLTAPNFSIVPRSTPVPDPNAVGVQDFGGNQTAEGSEVGGNGLFGDDDDGDDDDDDEDEDEDDDEEMEDVTAGLGGSGNMEGGASGGGGGGGMMGGTLNGTKRKAGESDEEYD